MTPSFDPVTNPVGLNGVDFIEYAGPQADHFRILFEKFGFVKTAELVDKNLELYSQGDIDFVINTNAKSFAADFHKAHGPSISSTGFRVFDAKHAFDEAVKRGAKPYTGSQGTFPLPAVYGIGDSLIYFVDAKGRDLLYKEFFKKTQTAPKGFGFSVVDHFTNNVPVGEMQKWCDFYQKVFHFRETRYFNIRGKVTGLISKVMRSPCGKFAVPINEPSDQKSQIQEYLDEYKGSGIQHLALLTDNVVATLEQLRKKDVQFLSAPPETYYKMLNDRVPHVTEDIQKLRENAILVDGDHEGYLLQIFTKNVIGPIFFEVIQRKGHDGFGDGNFQALFDAIEQDQKQRGYL